MKHWWSVRFCERLSTKHWRCVRHNVLVNIYRWNTEGVYGTTSESLLVIHWTGRRVVAVLPHQMMYSAKELCIFSNDVLPEGTMYFPSEEKCTSHQKNDVLPAKRTMYSRPRQRNERTPCQRNDVLSARVTMCSFPNNAGYSSTILIKAWTVSTKPSALILCLGVVRFISAVRFISRCSGFRVVTFFGVLYPAGA